MGRGKHVLLAAVMACVVAACNSGDAVAPARPTMTFEEETDRMVCEEAIKAWFDLLTHNSGTYESNEGTKAAFDAWRATFC